MTKWVGILGTWAYKPGDPRREWFQDGSTFSESLKRYGLEPARPEDDFVWSGDLDGTWFATGNDWEAGAQNLAFYLKSLPYEARNIIAHSHGGTILLQVATWLPIRSLVTIGTPARKETRAAGRRALESGRLGAWAHVSDKGRFGDWWGQLGALFDGQWRWARTMDLPGCREVRLSKIGHSSLLSGAHAAIWDKEGLFSLLRDGR